MLSQRLEALGEAPPLLLHEPGGTPLGEQLGQLLKHGLDTPLSPEAELLLFSAARAQLVREVITPALTEGRIVLCDRYLGSTLAYQGFGRGLDLTSIWEVSQLATQGLMPHVTLLLDVPVDVGLQRKSTERLQLSLFGTQAQDRFEDEFTSFHQRIRQGYLTLAMSPDEAYAQGNWVRIDGAQPVEAVADAIWAAVQPILGGRNKG